MAKSKSSSKPEKAVPSVKEGRVTKPAQTPIAKSKELAKQTVSNIKLKDEKSKKSKKVKEPTPEPESESESESDSASGSESDSDDSGSSISDSESDVSDSEMKDAGAAKAKTNGVAKAAADDSGSEDDSEESESEDEAPKVNGTSAPKVTANKAESDSESDSDSGSDDGSSGTPSEDSVRDARLMAGPRRDEDTSEESASSDDEAAPSKVSGVKVNGVAKKGDASSSEEDEDEDDESGSDVSSSDESEEEEVAPSKKRKAEEPVTPVAKKSKGFESSDSTATRNLFVGNLSWNVDEEWLAREFEGFGEIVGCRLITDRDSGRSKGYGYVEFADTETAAKAHAEKNGAMVDGREMRVDFSQGRTPKTNDNTPQRAERAQRYGDTVGKPADTLFCGNLSFDCTNDMLSDAFAEFGTITRVSLPRDRESDLPKGFGYVAFSTIEEATAAFEAMQGYQLSGRPMRLDYAGPRPDNGGAGGGRGGARGGRGGFGNRGGRGGFGDRGGRGGRGGARGGRGGSFGTTNRGGFGDFKGKKMTF